MQNQGDLSKTQLKAGVRGDVVRRSVHGELIHVDRVELHQRRSGFTQRKG